MHICSVCSEKTPKYKCPACRTRYCSLVCYKKHKDTCAPVKEPAPPCVEETASSTEPWNTEDLLDEDDCVDTVSSQRLQLLGESEGLRELLRNPHLRQLIRAIESADSKEDAMRTAMQEPLFVEFSDQCLQIVDNDGN
ncbi:zinc finger HIT domain-containing protein 3 [Lampris incognitus]|uniref:zinc finger HIT domain-containing protein 3 n=1 Tax=Lampris incognitus TaxID=2546036 RepID=UPI0024B62D25|nr:zinc finger HIT domain-containing protein 3 [Lampris incognitus]